MSRSIVGVEDIERFRESGFIRLRGLLAAEEVEGFEREVSRGVLERTRRDPRSLAEKSRYEQSFQQCLNLWEDFEAVRPLTFHPRIGEAAAALLDAKAVRIWHDQALYKEAGGRETDPHQDQPYWAIAENRTITAWIPLQEVSDRNGATGYLPGSHRSGLYEFANIFTSTGLDLDAHPETRNHPFEYLAASPGDVLFHHGLTVHNAKPNSTTTTRRIHTIIYFADGCTRRAMGHPSVDRAKIKIGEKIASDVTPIAWPRPAGDWPAPPSPPDPPLPGWPGWSSRSRSNRRSASPPDGEKPGTPDPHPKSLDDES